MSNLERDPAEIRCGGTALATRSPERTLLVGRDVPITKTTLVNRTLPHRDRRMIGAWCFVDHYGPDAVINMPGMRVPPHPHIGLQTVSWLFDGAVEHRDSLGSLVTIQPGQLNLMTAGAGIAHSEESPADRPPLLHGVQLWVALPADQRNTTPRFEHLPALPTLEDDGARVTVLVGQLAGHRSPAQMHSPIVGAEVTLSASARLRVPLEPQFEHGVLVVAGQVDVDGEALAPGALLYLGRGRPDLGFTADRPSRLMLLGGAPFEEQIVMWWNFVARNHGEIELAREDWEASRTADGQGASTRFAPVLGFDGDPLPAPALPNARLRPR